jgi:superfamily II DNA/RNA helicase
MYNKNSGFKPKPKQFNTRFSRFRKSSSFNKDRSNPRRFNPYNSESLRHDLYISKASAHNVTQEDIYDFNTSFEDFRLHPKLLKNIKERNYLNPTKIQAQVMRPILDKKDVLGLASTGSGKTAAFLIPVLNFLINDNQKKCLIIAPTRELVNQIQAEYQKFAQGTMVRDALIVGGASYAPQIRLLRRNPQLVIATCGRLIDLFKTKQINLNDFDIIVLDEVDQMLDMGFIHDIKLIVSSLKKEKQSLFFSATMNPKIEEIANSFLQNPVKIEIAKQGSAKNVDQDIVKIHHSKSKLDTLHEILVSTDFEKVLVFAKTKRGAEELSINLKNKGHKADALHGDKSLGQRMRIMASFRKNEIDILVATDVAARGIDIPDISHVINFDEPATKEDYIHRIGRTGRIGKKGVALTFVK